ncbi:uncharacterized protein LOC129959171 [Argiope bruennichi]|uniref:uncharacterized protein LOC129959171 n=1 Tax=Argiope bruennichi TaxID=94029 RepID=UPI002494D44E|nr:uncharacterized protein LOC129959171 [Argiope bruennichi]
MFARAGMSLHKWTSNSQELLNSFPTSNPENTFLIDEQVSKALGMHWKPFEDLFIFTVKYENESMLTKLTVLSVIARLYDPLGLLGPVISKMKIFLQKLWLQKLTFDDPLPPAIDASEAAYGAVIYLQCISANDIVTSRLVCSKSRVSPLKTVSIPRLELCGCLLAAQLKAKVEKALHLQIDSTVLYTDSTISLAWIQTPLHRLKTFFANRVGKIQQLTQNNKWQHVSSTLNPADAISRGLVPEQLIDNHLWWNGLTFLQELPVSVNSADQQMIDASQDSQFLLELKDNTTHTLVTLNSDFLTNFFKISYRYDKLIRVFSFLLRFLGNCRNKKMKGSLSSKEIEEAEFKLIPLVQQNVLADDFKNLASGKQVNPSSKLKSLSPFLEEGSNVIRVGGRLRNADIPFQVKFPIILPKTHILTKLIMQSIHLKNGHIGAQTLLHLARQMYWPIGGRDIARIGRPISAIVEPNLTDFSDNALKRWQRCEALLPTISDGEFWIGNFAGVDEVWGLSGQLLVGSGSNSGGFPEEDDDNAIWRLWSTRFAKRGYVLPYNS